MKIYLFFTAILTCSSCDSDTDPGLAQAEASLGISSSVEIIEVASGNLSGTEKRRFSVLDTQDTFEQEFSLFSQNPAPVLDFQTGVVLLASYGFAPSTDHFIEVSGVTDLGNYLEVDVVLKSPVSCFAGFIVTGPYQFVYIESRKLVVVQESFEDSCNSQL